ncbi:MAG TPA: peptidoglycan-binding protein [Mycobacteriales bacterium]|nr:peptidoglycan-binding protein [Mycobacteriales bacterium]
MRRAAAWAAVLTVLALLVPTSSARSTTWTHGFDVSWPQCQGAHAGHLPAGAPAYVVLGLTHGAGHTANPCFGEQLTWARSRGALVGAYLVPSYPTGRQREAATTGPFGVCTTLQCRLRNDGAAQAIDALEVMHAAGASVPMVWVDVEFRSHPTWSRHDDRNRAVLQGVFRALREARIRFGVYTTAYMWQHLTGGWQVRVPNWLPAGNGSAATARSRCRKTATGGPTWLVQYTREWDEDLTCPVMDATRGRPGPLWPFRKTHLELGNSGRAVHAAQSAIGAPRSGRYDALTTGVVGKFQVEHGLPVTGQIDRVDWRALGAYRRIGAHPFLLGRMTTR